MEILEATSLYDYIKILKDKKILDAFFRGESKKYSNIVASCYRNDIIGLDRSIIDEIIDEYFYEVSSQLSDIEKTNFIAYSQHHGLNTNLIDITSSAFVALYFSCCKNYENEGYVHVFKKNNFIKFGDEISGRKIKYFYNDLITKDNIKLLFYNKLSDYYKINEKDFILSLSKNLNKIKFILNKNIEDSENILKAIDWFNKGIEDGYVFTITHDFNYMFMEEFLRENKNHEIKLWKNIFNNVAKLIDFVYKPNTRQFSDYVIVYLTTFIYLLISKYNNTIRELPDFPLILYTPNIKFDRMTLQSGRFIYQNILFSPLNSLNKLKTIDYIQKIIPDISIKIKNKREILNDLDLLGINKINLFNDPDNIASYISNKNKILNNKF